ncbi:amidohydrolase [Dentipellis sp. KUC8613]|nr:amidohydrolase [Dentipellis sp. KUC8613]
MRALPPLSPPGCALDQQELAQLQYKPASADVEMVKSSKSDSTPGDVPAHAGCFSAIFRSRRRRAGTSNRQRSTGTSTGAPSTKRVDRVQVDASKASESAAAVGFGLPGGEEPPEYAHVTFASCCDFSGTLAREGAKPPAYFADVKELQSPEVIRTIEEKLEELDPQLRELSLKIHDHPELNFQEKFAHDLLTTFMSTHGFKVTPHYLGLDTAWRAEASHGTGGRVLGVNSEMDALPGIGHACGHNLIAVAGVGVALAVKAALAEHDIAGTVVLLGTPAEESGGGKQILLDRGGYKDMDACIMCHPFSGAPDNCFRVAPCLALQNIDVEYFGHTAHAAIAPWEGVNALDAAFLAYSSIAVLRQQIKPTHRVQGSVSGRDWTPNVIPDYAKMTWIVRAPTWAEVEVLRDRVVNCLEAAALSTGCKHKLTLGERYMDLRHNPVLAEAFAAVSQHHYNLPTQILDDTMPASTDFGNVTYALPALHPVFFIPTTEPNSSPHTPGFALAARTPGAHASMLRAARSLALTGLRVLADDAFFARVRAAYEAQGAGGV